MKPTISKSSTVQEGRDGEHSLPLLVGQLRAYYRQCAPHIKPREGPQLVKDAADLLAEASDRLICAERILDRLATGFWHHTLNDQSPGEYLGDQVLEYWRRYNGEVPPPRNLSSSRHYS